MIYHCTVYKQEITGSEIIDGDWSVLRAFLQRCKDDGASMVRLVRQSGDLAGVTHKVYFKKRMSEEPDYINWHETEKEKRLRQEMLKAVKWWDEVLKEMEKASEPGWFGSEERQHFTRDAYRLSALNDPVIQFKPPWEPGEDFNIHHSSD